MQTAQRVVNPETPCPHTKMCFVTYAYPNGDAYLNALGIDAVYWTQSDTDPETLLWRALCLQMLTHPCADAVMSDHGPGVIGREGRYCFLAGAAL